MVRIGTSGINARRECWWNLIPRALLRSNKLQRDENHSVVWFVDSAPGFSLPPRSARIALRRSTVLYGRWVLPLGLGQRPHQRALQRAGQGLWFPSRLCISSALHIFSSLFIIYSLYGDNRATTNIEKNLGRYDNNIGCKGDVKTDPTSHSWDSLPRSNIFKARVIACVNVQTGGDRCYEGTLSDNPYTAGWGCSTITALGNSRKFC